MTVHGVGIDIVCLPRIRALVDRYGEQFENRWFDPSELAQTGDPAVCPQRRSSPSRKRCGRRSGSSRFVIWRGATSSRQTMMAA